MIDDSVRATKSGRYSRVIDAKMDDPAACYDADLRCAIGSFFLLP
jgi:hypothetical protein